jgi:hypothetical protein
VHCCSKLPISQNVSHAIIAGRLSALVRWDWMRRDPPHFLCAPNPIDGLLLGGLGTRKHRAIWSAFNACTEDIIQGVRYNMERYSSSEESDVWVSPDPDERFERRLAEEEERKNELWTFYTSGAEFGLTHVNHVLTALGFLYGVRVKEEVRGGLRCLLEDRESFSQIGLTVRLRDRHLWDHYGHFNILEWGGVDLYVYLEKYGIECSGVVECWDKYTKGDGALFELWHNIGIVHGSERERDLRFLYDTVFYTYGNNLETVLTILRGKYDLFPFWRRSAQRLRDQQARDPFDWTEVLDAARYVLKYYVDCIGLV